MEGARETYLPKGTGRGATSPGIMTPPFHLSASCSPPVTPSPVGGSSPSALPLSAAEVGEAGPPSSVCCKQRELLAAQTPTNPASAPPRPEPTPSLPEPLLADCPWRLHSSPGSTARGAAGASGFIRCVGTSVLSAQRRHCTPLPPSPLLLLPFPPSLFPARLLPHFCNSRHS